MTLQDIRTLYEYNYWAKSRIMEVVESLTPEQYVRDMKSSYGGIQGTLVHIVGAEEIWVRRWKGDSPTRLAILEEMPNLEKLSEHWDMIEHEITGFCHMLKTDDDLARPFSFKDFKGNPRTLVLGQAMQHLVNHSSYHRGQVVTMLRQLDVKPAGTDMSSFYYQRGV
jgi:uncharacterized damage-inducible protein DinB